MSSAKSIQRGFNVASASLSGASAVFNLLLARDCIERICAVLVINEFVTAVLRGKPSNFAATMFKHPAEQVIRDTGVKYAIVIIGHDVDEKIVLSHHKRLFFSDAWRSREICNFTGKWLEIPRLRSE